MRPPVDTIPAPPLPRELSWMNVATLRMDQQRGRPVLVEFFDPFRVHSLRTLPYVRGWHERYEPAGLRVITVVSSSYPPGRDEATVRRAVERLGLEQPVALDLEFRVWRDYENRGWPARYLFGPELRLAEYHYGQGAYEDTERVICELLGLEREPLEAVRPADAPGARLRPPSADQAGAWSGPYEAGGVWALLDGHGSAWANDREIAVDGAECVPLIEHERHASGVLDLRTGSGVTCHVVQFEPGLA